MKQCWLVIGDVHNDVTRLFSIPEFTKAKGIIVTGDLTMAEGIVQAKKVVGTLEATKKQILAQPGNMDTLEVTEWLEEKGFNIHLQVKELPFGILCLGVGYSNPTPFKTPGEFPEEQFEHWLNKAVSHVPAATLESGQWILASHMPPYASTCDRLTNGTPVGSPSVRAFIEKYQPALCLCGHIHESVGIDTIGRTTIINPGPLSAGGYVLLTFEKENEQPNFRAERKML